MDLLDGREKAITTYVLKPHLIAEIANLLIDSRSARLSSDQDKLQYDCTCQKY